jgi:hypothetical protein
LLRKALIRAAKPSHTAGTLPIAFKHGVTEDSIRWVLKHHLFDGIVEEDDENKYLVLGFDEAGNLLEIMYISFMNKLSMYFTR